MVHRKIVMGYPILSVRQSDGQNCYINVICYIHE